MPTVQHSNLTGVNAIHVPYAGEYATAAARAAASDVSAADMGKLFRQLDDNSLWMLVSVSPLTWKEVGSMPPAATTEIAGLVQRATDAEASAGADTVKYVSPKQVKDVVNASIGSSELIIITTSQTWTAPDTGTIHVTLCGGGGGGSGGTNISTAGGNGGNGGKTTAFNVTANGGNGGVSGTGGYGYPSGGNSNMSTGGAAVVSYCFHISSNGRPFGSSGSGGNGNAGTGGGGGGAGQVLDGVISVTKGMSYSITIGSGGYGGGSSAGSGAAGLQGACVIQYL